MSIFCGAGGGGGGAGVSGAIGSDGSDSSGMARRTVSPRSLEEAAVGLPVDWEDDRLADDWELVAFGDLVAFLVEAGEDLADFRLA
jgi:hypothetical protein